MTLVVARMNGSSVPGMIGTHSPRIVSAPACGFTTTIFMPVVEGVLQGFSADTMQGGCAGCLGKIAPGHCYDYQVVRGSIWSCIMVSMRGNSVTVKMESAMQPAPHHRGDVPLGFMSQPVRYRREIILERSVLPHELFIDVARRGSGFELSKSLGAQLGIPLVHQLGKRQLVNAVPEDAPVDWGRRVELLQQQIVGFRGVLVLCRVALDHVLVDVSRSHRRLGARVTRLG